MSSDPAAEPTNPPPRVIGLAGTLLADAAATAALRGERHDFTSKLDAVGQMLRLALVSDAFAGQAFFRLGAALRRRRVPVLPALLRRLAIASAAIYVDERAIVHPGVYFVHGQVVIDGPVVIHPGAVISPAVTLAAEPGGRLVIGPGVSLGTGSRVLGSFSVGARAKVGAGSVVLSEVPAGATAVGIPAVVRGAPEPG